jgi:hypothetical protein
VTVVDFTAFVLSHLPPAPARVLELGCGDEGGVTPALAEAGYEPLGIDPVAPDGPLFRRISLDELEEGDSYDAVVASRVLHHVDPLDPALAKLARLAPLLLVDEFAHERLDGPTRDWYEQQYRILAASGSEPDAPPDLGAWRERHRDLHPSAVVLSALRDRYDQLHFEWRPYLYRWLRGPATEGLEESLIRAGAISAVGFRYAGARTETVRSESAAPR